MSAILDSVGPYAPFLVFVLAAAEAAAFVGLFIPGEAAVVFGASWPAPGGFRWCGRHWRPCRGTGIKPQRMRCDPGPATQSAGKTTSHVELWYARSGAGSCATSAEHRYLDLGNAWGHFDSLSRW